MRAGFLPAIFLMSIAPALAQKAAGGHNGGAAPAVHSPAAPAAAPQMAAPARSSAPVQTRTPPGVGPNARPSQQPFLPYQTGAIPQPGYNIGIAPGLTRNDVYPNNRRGNGRFGGFFGVPYLPGYLTYGSTDLNSFPSYGDSAYIGPGPAPEPAPAATAGNDEFAQAQAEMATQIRQLSSQLADLKQAYAPQSPAPAAAPASEPAEPVVPLHLVLRTGQQYAVKNFAVMNGELWDLGGQRVRKIPVDSIDVPASTRATEAAGGQFPSLRTGS